jgi:hypothetical protein
MAVTPGILGEVTSWGSGSDFTQVLISTNNKPAEFSLDIKADSHDRTTFVSTGATFGRVIKGMHSWDGKITAHLGTPQIGSLGNVTFASGYTTNVYAYELNIVADVHPATVFAGASGVKWRGFVPGLVRVTGSFECYADSSTAIAAPGLDAEAAAVTFDVVAGATGKTIGGSIVTTAAALSVAPSRPNIVKYQFVFDSQVTTSGTGTILWAADAGGGVFSLTTPVLGKTLTLKAFTSQSYSGTAFWKSIGLKVAVDAPVILDIGYQGYGALTGVTGVA